MEQIALNYNWRFSEQFKEQMIMTEFDDSNLELVQIPHTVKEVPYHYFDETIYQFVSCYRKKFKAEKEWIGKRVFLKFDGVAHQARVFVNEKELMVHRGGYTAFEVEITDVLKYQSENVITVEVDSREELDFPPFGGRIDYLTYGGIYREVNLLIANESYISDIFIKTDAEFGLDTEVTIESCKEDMMLKQSLRFISGSDDSRFEPITVTVQKISNAGNTIRFKCHSKVEAKLWSLEEPNLYELKTELVTQGRVIDEKTERFGFRSCEFRTDGFYLNGKKIKVIGLNRHQAYPYVGYAMPKRAQQTDADILKKELHVQAVRTSHYPQSHHFINRCDEIGLLVFTEIPGWQHIGGKEWKEEAKRMTSNMVKQYRNHPSIVLWGVRINESQDDDDFYLATNEIAHNLDSTRQTGGVRFISKSHLLEDVYTYNDFIHRGTNRGLENMKRVIGKKKVPYLISEHNGHMYPTKSFDWEQKREEHANRHARVLNDFFAHVEISACFGWCMFDYNTHQDFGSGDRICYHGVMDMFRNPKLAAAVYASQQGTSPVLRVGSSMDIGEHPGGYLPKAFVYTNADSIKIYKNDVFITESYPDKKDYPYLPHAPFCLEDFVGDVLEQKEHFSAISAKRLKKVLRSVEVNGLTNIGLKSYFTMFLVMIRERVSIADAFRMYGDYFGNWGTKATIYRFDAIKDGKVVQSVTKDPNKQGRLKVTTDTTQLCEEDTYDVASIRIEVVDQYGERLTYFQEPVCFEISGSIELIGPKVVSLRGGVIGTYVKTKQETGKGTLSIRCGLMEQVDIHFVVF